MPPLSLARTGLLLLPLSSLLDSSHTAPEAGPRDQIRGAQALRTSREIGSEEEEGLCNLDEQGRQKFPLL